MRYESVVVEQWIAPSKAKVGGTNLFILAINTSGPAGNLLCGNQRY
jgi:hypothetical protein